MGPNVKKLITRKMSFDAIPRNGSFADGVRFLSDPKAVGQSARAATEWATTAIRAVREAAEPNPWKNSSDEEIAGEILRKIGAQ